MTTSAEHTQDMSARVLRFRARVEKPEGAIYACPECGVVFTGSYDESGLRMCLCGVEAAVIAKIAKVIKTLDSRGAVNG